MKEKIIQNKKIVIIIIIICILALLLIFCKILSNKRIVVNFKNPKTIAVTNNKHNVSVTYDDNGKTKFIDGDIKTIENEKDNFKIKLKINNYTVKEQERVKQNFLNSKDFIVKDVKIGDYKGYYVTDNKKSYTLLFLYVNEREDVVLEAKISPSTIKEVEKKLKKGTSPEDIIYNLDEVQKILSTINYR